LLNKPTVLEPIPKPIFDISNIYISDSDEENERVIHIDGDTGSF